MLPESTKKPFNGGFLSGKSPPSTIVKDNTHKQVCCSSPHVINQPPDNKTSNTPNSRKRSSHALMSSIVKKNKSQDDNEIESTMNSLAMFGPVPSMDSLATNSPTPFDSPLDEEDDYTTNIQNDDMVLQDFTLFINDTLNSHQSPLSPPSSPSAFTYLSTDDDTIDVDDFILFP